MSPLRVCFPAKTRGFTLIELLVAMAVFAFLAAAAFGGLNAVLKTRDHTSQAAESLRRLQMSLTIMQRDFLQLSNTTVRDAYGDTLPAITTQDDDSLIEFTHSGWSNPTNQARSNLQRVAYVLEDNTLYRQYWPRLHRSSRQEPIQAILLEDIEDIEFEFLSFGESRWQEQWPPINQTGTIDLPIATRVTITFSDESKAIRIFGVNQ